MTRSRRKSSARGPWAAAALVLLAAVTAAGLVGVPTWSRASDGTAAPGDPWRPFNRRSYAVGSGLDRVLIGPIARVYKRITPAPLRKGLGNALDNLREPATALNGLAQARPKLTARAAARFVINSTVGIGGLFDVAGRAGLERQRADVGQTLGRYGVGTGPYLYLPVVGPTNLRDGVGRIVGAAIDPVSLATGGAGTDFAAGRAVAGGLDVRAEADDALRALDDATDPYAATRSAYEQYRAAVVREATGEAEDLPDFGDEPAEPAAETPLPPLSEADAMPAPGV